MFTPPTTHAPPSPSGAAGGRVVGFVERVKCLLLTPASGWALIAGEPTQPADVYLGHVMPLAGMSVIATVLGATLVGIDVGGPAHVRVGLDAAFVWAVFQFLLTLAGVWLLARWIDRLAATFRGRRDARNALRVAAYSLTPVWLAAVVTVVPRLSPLVLLGVLYGAYLLYVGLTVLMESPPAKAIGYAVSVAMAAVVMSFIATMVTGFALGAAGAGTATLGPSLTNDARIAGAAGRVIGGIFTGGTSADRTRMKDALVSLVMVPIEYVHEAILAMPPPQREPADAPSLERAGAAIGLIATGGKVITPVAPERLEPFLPVALAGMTRREVSSKVQSDLGLKGSIASARYGNEAGHEVTLTVVDLGTASGITSAFSAFDPLVERVTEYGYERRWRIDGNLMRERYVKRDRSGDVDLLLAGDRFGVRAHGLGVETQLLHDAVRAVDVGKLAGLDASTGRSAAPVR